MNGSMMRKISGSRCVTARLPVGNLALDMSLMILQTATDICTLPIYSRILPSKDARADKGAHPAQPSSTMSSQTCDAFST